MTSKEERSQWGRSMLAKRGGYAVQERYRREGRIGAQHPAHKAAKKSVERRRDGKKKREFEQQLSHALPASPQTRRRMLPIWS
jgi:hypothetical protein